MEYIVNIEETPEGERRLRVHANNEHHAIREAERLFPDTVPVSAYPVLLYKQRPGDDACHNGHPRCSTYWGGPCSRNGELDHASQVRSDLAR